SLVEESDTSECDTGDKQGAEDPGIDKSDDTEKPDEKTDPKKDKPEPSIFDGQKGFSESGTGDDVRVVTLSAGGLAIKSTNDGDSNFIVRLHNASGEQVDLLANAIG